MLLHNNRYEEIKRKVAEVFKKYDVRCFPISGFELATKMGIKCVPYPQEPQKRAACMRQSKYGFKLERNGKLYIFYNDEMRYVVINFTFMHEIGHIIFGHTQPSDLAEAEATFFAAYAVAPTILIRRLGIHNSLELADVLQLSYSTANYSWQRYLNRIEYGGIRCYDYELVIDELFSDSIKEYKLKLQPLQNKRFAE